MAPSRQQAQAAAVATLFRLASTRMRSAGGRVTFDGRLRSPGAGHPELATAGELRQALGRVSTQVVAACASRRRVDIVAIDGSAGGLQAPLGLSRYCKMPIAHAIDGGTPILGPVFVAPRGRHLASHEGRLRLLDGPRVRCSRPSVDVPFTSRAVREHGKPQRSLATGAVDIVDDLDGLRRVVKRVVTRGRPAPT